jgi:hypothetical protein
MCRGAARDTRDLDLARCPSATLGPPKGLPVQTRFGISDLLAAQEEFHRRRAHLAPHPASAAFKHRSPPLTCPHLSLTFHSPTLTSDSRSTLSTTISVLALNMDPHSVAVQSLQSRTLARGSVNAFRPTCRRPVFDLEMVPLDPIKGTFPPPALLVREGSTDVRPSRTLSNPFRSRV